MDKYDLTTADQDIAVQTILTDLCEIFGQEAVYISLGGTYGMDHHTGDEHHSSPVTSFPFISEGRQINWS